MLDIVSPVISAVTTLQPARDMTTDVATIDAARADLAAALLALLGARAAGLLAVRRLTTT